MHPNAKNLIGQHFGRLIAIRPTKKRKHRSIVWECKCSCGQRSFVLSNSLLSGRTNSCGCILREYAKKLGLGNKGRSGEKNGNWKGGRSKAVDGYMLILYHGHSRADSHGYVREHILVSEKALGKPLPSGVVIHHINGIKDDNRRQNLIICQDETYHRLLHKRMIKNKKGE